MNITEAMIQDWGNEYRTIHLYSDSKNWVLGHAPTQSTFVRLPWNYRIPAHIQAHMLRLEIDKKVEGIGYFARRGSGKVYVIEGTAIPEDVQAALHTELKFPAWAPISSVLD